MEISSAESNKLATVKTILSAAASLAATVMLARSVTQDLVPGEIHHYISHNIRRFFGRFSSQFTMVIDEFDGFVSNQIYESAETYLSTKVSPTTQRLRVIKPEKEKIAVKMERHEEIEDVFEGVKFRWVLVCRKAESQIRHNPSNHDQYMYTSEDRAFEVTFSKKYKNMVLESYIPYVIEKAKSMMQENKTVKIFTMSNERMYGNLGDAWTSVNLDHPSTFDTLAMDSELKDMILKDLERFVQRKEHYRKIGKAWKRGYLLYGPPGTGKSSLIAAMANHLNFNIYDLELTNVGCNSDLRRLLLATANKSILVVEDIDCTIDFQERNQARREDPDSHGHSPEKQVTLSGLLNSIDGLWSSCGDERIIIFTTNHKEKLDAALLRPGRMDVHIHMSYCTPCGFRDLASTYLGIKDHHPLFVDIEDLIESTEVTPAEVAEQLLRNDEVEAVLNDLIVFLHAKKTENKEAKAKKRLQEEAIATQKQEDEKAEKKEQGVELAKCDKEEIKHNDNKTENLE